MKSKNRRFEILLFHHFLRAFFGRTTCLAASTTSSSFQRNPAMKKNSAPAPWVAWKLWIKVARTPPWGAIGRSVENHPSNVTCQLSVAFLWKSILRCAEIGSEHEFWKETESIQNTSSYISKSLLGGWDCNVRKSPVSGYLRNYPRPFPRAFFKRRTSESDMTNKFWTDWILPNTLRVLLILLNNISNPKYLCCH